MQNVSALCTVCDFRLDSKSLLREHYKTEWHNYNQKRKLANKDPVSEMAFKRKIELLECTKVIMNKGSSHIKNKQKMDIQENDNGNESLIKINQDKPRQSDTYELTYCYFDNTIHSSLEECFEYMRIKYSFIIPDREYLVDYKGLARYLGDKLFEGHICLYCDKTFSSLRAVRDHMISLGHTMLGTHLDIQKEELEGFYNYSQSYKELIPNFNKLSISNYPDKDENNDEWEYVDEDENDNDYEYEDNIGKLNGKEISLDEILSSYNLRKPEITEFGDLRLPNGKEVVHRDLAYIYKQRIPRKQEVEMNDGNHSIILKNIHHNKKIHLYGTSQFSLNLKFRDKSHLKQNLLLSKRIKNVNLKVGVNNNKLQKYFVRRDVVW
ncbi:zinc finger protein [Cryptosporidium sp. chipmunk genotype I]|uniref:zinc finger protein n=1 Tax=Cryptosporidium sp. chipmunk genotype I TaxID=1280935 RepID=UPI00351A243F|nr:zinc finger protein [Cryptosporidium sp. chipmunk genotype I]